MEILVLSGVFVFIFFVWQRKFQDVYYHAGQKAAPVKSWALPVPQGFRDILLKYFPYYRQLLPADKAAFERKLCTFIYSKRFIPRNIDEVTIEAKVLIAASAVQLTFGLPNVYLRHFSKILVYPNDYYSSITKHFHKGEVNPRFGIIVLSWQSFVDGYIYPNDSFNLGLHEMTHALRLENIIRNEEYHFFDKDLLEKLDEHARNICKDIQNKRDPFFRPYACVNEHEFFSVAVENFFERPGQFKVELPEVYDILTKLLAQDPLQLTILNR
jgi:Mlc titration factor MtfA (ptsG expression regulator)